MALQYLHSTKDTTPQSSPEEMEPVATPTFPRHNSALQLITVFQANLYQTQEWTNKEVQAGRAVRRITLRMIRFVAQECVQKWLAGRLLTSTSRLNRNEHCIDLRELLGIVKAHDPATVRFAVHV